MSFAPEVPAEQIVIVRRRAGGEDEHHHGGVWKIAYADFMTAMMAFFLVMWLINASNTETKASVASYFNPIKLTDALAKKKGLHKADDKSEDDKKGAQPKVDAKEPAKKNNELSTSLNEHGARDGEPEKLNARVTSTQSPDAAAIKEERDAIAASSREAGKAFRDPFNPLSPSSLLARPAVVSVGMTDAANAPPGAAGPVEATRASATGQAATKASSGSSPAPNAGEVAVATDGVSAAAQHKALARIAEVVRRRAEEASRLLGTSGGPGIDVTIEGDSIVLSLTDTSTFGMFSVGSAEPNAELIQLLQNLAPTVAANGEHIILRGHTDSRPFRFDTKNNNWRLAMARADAAYTMLVRAGVDEARFERIEAHADRKPKVAKDGEAAANRRIEIILRNNRR